MPAYRSFLAALLLVASPCALAAADPTAARERAPDSRLRTEQYEPGRVVDVAVALGYQALISFGPGERIDEVSIGDSTSWQVVPNRRGDVLFLKPMRAGGATNMIVVTNLRRYAFDLTARTHGARDAIYALQFAYPEEDSATTPAADNPLDHAEQLDFSYSLSGAHALYPARTFSDGIRTYFQFAPDAPLPAIFAISADGAETSVNTQMRGPYLVADASAPAYVLRYGRLTARVTHEDRATAEPQRPSILGSRSHP